MMYALALTNGNSLYAEKVIVHRPKVLMRQQARQAWRPRQLALLGQLEYLIKSLDKA